MKFKMLFGLLLSLMALAMFGCGDDDGGTSPFATAPVATAPAASIDGTTATSTITATLPAGTADGTVVNFVITSGSGTLSAATAATVGGVATVTLTSTAPGDVVVTVTSGSSSSPVTVTFPAGALVVTANPSTVVINSTSVISAQLPTATAGVTVSFALTGTGTLPATAVTDATGLATVTLTAPATTGTATVTATAGLLVGNNVNVTYITDPNLPGSVTITANPTSAFVNQSVVITATVAPAGPGGVIADGTVVSFASTLGTFSNITTTTGGVATATLTGTTTGTASVTATVAGITTPTPASVLINALPVQAVVKLAINGTLPAGTTIDGAQFILNYVTTKGLSIVDTPAAIAASNGAVANLIINNVGVNGVVNSAFANANASPIATQTGEFATLTFTITGATTPFPELADFTIASSTVTTTPATPLTISVLSVTLL